MDPIQHLPVYSDVDADLWSKSMDQHGWNIWGSAPLWSLCLFPGWAKRSRRHLRCHNRQAPNITCMPGVHQSIHQSSKTNIYSTLRALILFRRRRFINHLLTYLCRKRIRCQSLCTETTHHQRIAWHDCLPSIRSSVMEIQRLVTK